MPLTLSDDARAVLDCYIATSAHVGEAAEKMAAEIVGLLDRLDDAERRAAMVSRGLIRRAR